MNPIPILPGNAQHRGDRAEQQDSFGFSDLLDVARLARQGALAVLADGMGGHALGRAASQIAVKIFLDGYPHKTPDEPISVALRRLLQDANTAMRALAEREGELDNAGSTLAAAVIHQQCLHWIGVGDSRIYLYRAGRLTPLTADHVYARELDREVAAGHIDAMAAADHPDREALTSFLGVPELEAVAGAVRFAGSAGAVDRRVRRGRDALPDADRADAAGSPRPAVSGHAQAAGGVWR